MIKPPYRYRGLMSAAALLLLLPFMIWRYAIGDTVRSAVEYRRLRLRAAMLAETPDCTTERAPVDAAVPAHSGRLIDDLQPLLDGRDVRITGYAPFVTRRECGLTLHTFEMTLTGSFDDLLHCLHRIELECPSAAVRSVAWSTHTDRLDHSQRLLLTLCLQRLTKTDDI